MPRVRLHPTILCLASAHFLVDAFGGIYAPLLPLLIPKLRMSLAMAGTLTMLFQMSASVMQLAFGHLADRWRPRLLVMGGPILAVIVLSLMGLAESTFWLGATLVIGGLGTSAFHPPAAALVHRLAETNRGFAMSFHITAGTIGMSLAPLLFAPVVQAFGLRATPLLALPGLILLAFVLRGVPRGPFSLNPARAGLGVLRPYRRPLALLYSIVVLRTLTSLSFATFVPVMLTRRGWSVAEAGAAATAYLLASGVGGFLGGPLADRFGARRVIIWSLLLAVPFLATAPLLAGPWFVIVLAVGGFFLLSTLPVNVTFAHAIAPVSAATVSSLMMGFAWGTGGLSVPLVGMLADRIGIDQSLFVFSFMPLLAALCALPLPSQARGEGLEAREELGSRVAAVD
jgi:FSR family fosmidomycin resistance protein-like MFS transporter